MQSAYARCTEAIVCAYADLTYSVLENVMCVLLLMLIDEGKMFWVNACISHHVVRSWSPCVVRTFGIETPERFQVQNQSTTFIAFHLTANLFLKAYKTNTLIVILTGGGA